MATEDQQTPKGNLKPQVYKDERPAEHFTHFLSLIHISEPTRPY